MSKPTSPLRVLILPIMLVLTLVLPAQGVRGEGAPPGLTGGPLGNSNAIFTGETASNYAGFTSANAGDVNGDGYADLLIGGYGYASSQGRAYLFLGGPGGWRLDQGVAAANAIYTGEGTSNYASFSLAGAGDVNNDGYDDIIIGAYGVSSNQGRAYLVLGSAAPASIGLGSANAIYTGEASSMGGRSVAGAGDVNGDGYGDLLIGAMFYNGGQGRAYLVLGSATPTSIANLGAMTVAQGAIYTGETSDGWAGCSAAGAGDVNGDGYADFLIGAYNYNSGQGRVYLMLGSATPASIGLGSASAKYTGEAASNNAGRSMAGTGDVNGDGYADFLIGAPYYNTDWGRAYLVLGSANPAGIGLGSANAIYTAEAAINTAGTSLSAAGDVNGDGYADMLIGSDAYGSGTGRAYVVLGKASLASMGLGGADIIYTGEGSANYAATSIAGGGDVNGDGYSDLLVGAYYYGTGRGRAYLVFSDYNTSIAARYRALLPAGNLAATRVGPSGVTVDYSAGASGSVYATRLYRSSCNTAISSGMLWRVDSERGSAAVAALSFEYNDTQIAGLTEANLKLYYRSRVCQDWTQDTGATLDTAHNRITSSAVTDPHREYTIATTQPSPTLVTEPDATIEPGKPDAQAIALLGVLVLAAGAIAWERRRVRELEGRLRDR